MKKLLNQIASSFKAWNARRRYERCVKQANKILASSKVNFSAKYPGCEGALMAATWPPISGTTPGFTVKGGVTTIRWGTEGLLSDPYPASGGGFYTVTNFKEKPIIDRTKLPNGNGMTSSDVFIQDGVTWDLTVRDDSRMTPPVINGAVKIVDTAGLLGTVGKVYAARLVDTDYSTSLKNPGEHSLICDNLLLIDDQTVYDQTAR